MVDPAILANDVLQTVAAVALPPVLWLFLYLFAWEEPDAARSVGFGRLTFWLLLPGALVGVLGNLPVFGFRSDLLAVNIGGGAIPVVLSLYLLYRLFLPSAPALARFVVAFAVESAALLAIAILVVDPRSADVAALAIAALAPVALYGTERAIPSGPSQARNAALLLALVSAAIWLTFLTSSAVPNQGIVSDYPYYLAAPTAVGIAAPLLARRWLQGEARLGLPAAYASTTLGVLVGADVLRQPPLYQGGPAALFAIGGAGLLDLLYLAGLLAVAISFLVVRRFPRPLPPTTPGAAEPPISLSPGNRLRRALLLALTDRSVESVRESVRSAHQAIEQAQRLAGPPGAPPPPEPWTGLGVAPYVANDLRNLDALGTHPPTDERETARAFVTARFQVQIASEVGQRRFGSFERRALAFAFDVGLLLVPATLLWLYLARTLPGSSSDILAGAGYFTSIFGFAAYALLYVILMPLVAGGTLGKRLLHLSVTDRALRPPRPLAQLLRELPKLIPLTVIGAAGAVAALILGRGESTISVSPTTGALSLSTGALTLAAIAFLLVIVLVGCALVTGGFMRATDERQRLGDYLAGTWVVTDPLPVVRLTAPGGTAAGAPHSGPGGS